jgi:hypothetical protein
MMGYDPDYEPMYDIDVEGYKRLGCALMLLTWFVLMCLCAFVVGAVQVLS